MAVESTSTSTEKAAASAPPVRISSRFVRRAAFTATALVSLAGLVMELLKELRGWSSDYRPLEIFSLSYEANLPTWYTVGLLLFCASALAMRARGARFGGERDAPGWWGLSLGFFYISVDELTQIHEMGGMFFDLDGVLYFSWVIPAAVVVLLVGLSYVGFLRRLDSRTRTWFVVAGALYVAGAVLCELPLGWWTDRYGSDNLGYGLIDWAEETLEIVGLSLFAWALVEHHERRGTTVAFGVPS